MKRYLYWRCSRRSLLPHTAAQAAEYTLSNVLAGSDNWEPDAMTEQAGAPVVGLSGTTLTWNDNDSVLCWMVFRDDTFYRCVTAPECPIASGEVKANYFVRAANAMGGLGAASNVVDADGTAVRNSARRGSVVPSCSMMKKTIRLDGSAATHFRVTVVSLDGKKMLFREFSSGLPAGGVELPVAGLAKGVYPVTLEYDGLSHSRYLTVY